VGQNGLCQDAVLIRCQTQHHPFCRKLVAQHAGQFFCSHFVGKLEKLLPISEGNMIDKDNQLRPSECRQMILTDTKLPESPADAHHEVGIGPVNVQELYNDVEELWIFILELAQAFSDGEKAISSEFSGEVISVIDWGLHDFALQWNLLSNKNRRQKPGKGIKNCEYFSFF
jgi:hypothetical protein